MHASGANPTVPLERIMHSALDVDVHTNEVISSPCFGSLQCCTDDMAATVRIGFDYEC